MSQTPVRLVTDERPARVRKMNSHALASYNSQHFARDKCLKESPENTELGPLHCSRYFSSPSLISRQRSRTARNFSTPTAPSATALTEPETQSSAKQSGQRIWAPPKPRS